MSAAGRVVLRGRPRRRGGDGARPRHGGVRRRAADLRRGRPSGPSRSPPSSGRARHRPPARARRARALGERAGPRCPGHAQRRRVHRGHAGCLPGPRRPLQRQPALPPGGGARPVRRHRRAGGRLPPPVPVRWWRRRATRRRVVLIDVDDGSGIAPLPGSTSFEEAATTPVDRSVARSRRPTTCTSSAPAGPRAGPRRCYGARPTSTSRPWPARRARPTESIAEAAPVAGAGAPWYPVPPLMHAAAQWTAFSGLHQGATVVVHDDSGSFDARQRPAAGRARAGRVDVDRRRRVRRSHRRGAAAAGPTTCRPS